MFRTTVIALSFSLSSAAIAAEPPVAPPPAAARAPAKPSQCFWSRDFESWRAINDHSFYIRTEVNTFFRIDLAEACPELMFPNARLITTVRGSSQICDALDWDLKVSESPPGISAGCIVESQTRLTPQEAAAIPPKLKP